jgi:signal transduction histidine kinase
MAASKNEIIASVARAKIELDQALEDLQSLPVRDPFVSSFICRALENYIHITSATLILLTRELGKHSNRQIPSWIEGLKIVTQRMQQLVDQLKGVPSKTPRSLVFRKVDISILIRRGCDFYRRIAGRKQIQIVFENAAPDRTIIWTDRVAVAAIMDNLLSNAITSSPRNKVVSVKIEAQRAHVVCSVRDQRPGGSRGLEPRLLPIAPTRKGRVQSTQDDGLAVASELVALLGGEIWSETEPGHGACFAFSLPSSRRTRPPIRTDSKVHRTS